MYIIIYFFFLRNGDHRDLHLLTHSFPTRRSSDLPRLSRNPVIPVMPDTIITKPPSAELRPDQKDEDSLPAYADLDRMLHMLVEEEASVDDVVARSEEHTSELQSLMRHSYAVFCLKKKQNKKQNIIKHT